MRDCLREAMDVDGLKAVLEGIRKGRIRTTAVDLPEPSPLSHQLLNSAPYTYLDDAPLEERRARAVSMRRTLPPEDAAAFGALDAGAIAQVVADAQPPMRDADELHDALLQLNVAPAEQVPLAELDSLVQQRRVARFETGEGRVEVVAAERVAYAEALYPGASLAPPLQRLPGDGVITRDAAVLGVVRGRMEIGGPLSAVEVAQVTGLHEPEVNGALLRLESEGQVLRGQFRPMSGSEAGQVLEWCDRRLLQRIHRLTVGKLRIEIQPLTAQAYMRFLFRWHHLEPGERLRGHNGLVKAVSLLQGFEAPAAALEHALLPARMAQYLPDLLERASFGGEVAWGRLTVRDGKPPPIAPGPRRGAPSPGPMGEHAPRSVRGAVNRNASLTFVRRADLEGLLAAARPNAVLADGGMHLPSDLSPPAKDVAEALERRGALFFSELCSLARRLPAEVEDALWELLSRGLVTADAVENLRVLQSPKLRKRRRATSRGGPGRWSLLAPHEVIPEAQSLELLAKTFLFRYGIVWRDVVMRESLAPPWRELLFVYRRMEARGEIRGGRFVSGFAGEQFALPDAVEMARSVRKRAPSGQRITIAAVDPLNLTGVVTPGPRVPSMMGNWVVYVDGVPQGEEPALGSRGELG
jgi:ATP-dependent Lhr-like helicase